MKNQFDVLKERDNRLIYEERKKLTFEEWKCLDKEKKKYLVWLAVIFLGLVMIIYIGGYFYVVSYYQQKKILENYREAIPNLAKEICENINQELVNGKLWDDGEYLVICNKEQIIIGGEE